MSADHSGSFDLHVSPDADLAYLRLPTHPGQGRQRASASQIDLMGDFNIGKNVKVLLDVDRDGEIIGIEVILY